MEDQEPPAKLILSKLISQLQLYGIACLIILSKSNDGKDCTIPHHMQVWPGLTSQVIFINLVVKKRVVSALCHCSPQTSPAGLFQPGANATLFT